MICCLWLVGQSYGQSERISYSYDSLNRLIRVAYGTRLIIIYTYDAAGNRISTQVQTLNPIPTLSSLNPSGAVARGAGFTLTVTGTGFVNGSTIQWNGANRATTFIDKTRLSTAIPSSDIFAVGTASITVSNPAPGGGVSNTLPFSITQNCAYSIAPTTQSFEDAGGSGSVAVMASSGCAWTASSNASWLSVTAGSGGNGNGTVNYLVAVNSSTSSRTGTLSIAGRTLTIVQAGMVAGTYAITGRVTSSGSGVGGVTLTLSGSQSKMTQTDNSGNYAFGSLAAGGNYTITPTKPNYTFTPPNQSFSNLSANQTANFTSGGPTVASVSAASYSDTALAAESIVSAFGSGLATGTQVATSTPLPTTLAGTTVRIRDGIGMERQAPLFFVSPTQVNYQVPPGAVMGMATVTVSSGNGTASTGTAQFEMVAPGLFTANASGRGIAAAAVLRVKADNSQSFESVAQFDSTLSQFLARPIDLGPATDQVFLLLFGTGFRYRSSLLSVSVRIGGEDAQVVYAGGQGDFVGLDQINARIPRSLIGRGEVDVTLIVDGKTANTVHANIK